MNNAPPYRVLIGCALALVLLLMGSRWAAVQSVPFEDVVVVRYDTHRHTLRPLSEVPLSALEGYNIGSAGPPSLKTNLARLLAPIDQFP